MATISNSAIFKGKKLSGSAIRFREGIAAHCTSYNPTTGEQQQVIAESVGMDNGQASRAVKELCNSTPKQVHYIKSEPRFYLLCLDEFQLLKLDEKNPKLLQQLADFGSVDAQNYLIRKKSAVAEILIPVGMLQYLMKEIGLSQRHLKNINSQFGVDIKSILIDIKSILYKKENGLNGVLNDDDKNGASFPDKKTGKETPNSSNPQKPAFVEDPKLVEWREPHLRRDLVTDDWFKYLQTLPESENIVIPELWQEMTNWCKDNQRSIHRQRFLNWIYKLFSAIPVEIQEQNAITKRPGKQSGGGSLDERDSKATDRLKFTTNAAQYLESERGLQAGNFDENDIPDLFDDEPPED